jgi:uncharacterized protein with GYD domain
MSKEGQYTSTESYSEPLRATGGFMSPGGGRTDAMPSYITLWEYTQQGVENVRESPERIDEIEEMFEGMGGELQDYYMLMGQYDTITISEFPDDETAAQAILAVAEQGNVTPETLRAFSREATRELIDGLP